MKHVMTVDLEYDWESLNADNIKIILPKLLDFFDNNHITATFFVLGEIAEKFPDEIKSIPKKHEIASHSFSHIFMDKFSAEDVENQIVRSKLSLEKLGIRVEGFRCPYFVSPENKENFYSLLEKHGFSYDSSLSTFFPGRYSNFMAKTVPYKVSCVQDNSIQDGSGIIELPMPNFIPKLLPAGLSYYRLAYPFSKVFASRLPYMVYLHPCEFLNKPIGKEINFFVRQLYKHNQGPKAWRIFTEFIHDTETEWISCKEYIDRYLGNLKVKEANPNKESHAEDSNKNNEEQNNFESD